MTDMTVCPYCHGTRFVTAFEYLTHEDGTFEPSRPIGIKCASRFCGRYMEGAVEYYGPDNPQDRVTSVGVFRISTDDCRTNHREHHRRVVYQSAYMKHHLTHCLSCDTYHSYSESTEGLIEAIMRPLGGR